MLREHYLDLALEMVDLRERIAQGGDDVGALGERLTDLEDILIPRRDDGEGLTGDEWIDEHIAEMLAEGSQVTEYDFDGGRRDESQNRGGHQWPEEDRGGKP
jgi:hypothetical protein